MNHFLQNSLYVFDDATRLWRRPGYVGIAYSDGDETEEHIAKIVEAASDRSVLSTELRQHCNDWPTTYHLSGTRANVLRPFSGLLKDADVLEVGAGCGAITRFLAEAGANVLALEGSVRRAHIARVRTDGMNNVTVLSERFDEFVTEKQFDVVTLIGVLEYANVFTRSTPAALAMLKHIRSLLKPNGRVIIAIENQLGLKYFSGAPEDHLGKPMYGIEGRYRSDEPQTFGKRVLDEILRDAGFVSTEFMAPFPDYKLPLSIVTEEGMRNKAFDACAFAWQSARRDPQLPEVSGFSIELAWQGIFDNGLGMDVSNSFIAIGSPLDQPLRSSDADVLAFHYSTDRAAQYCKAIRFRPSAGDDVVVQYERLSNQTADTNEALSLIDFNVPETDAYRRGRPLAWDFVHTVTRDDWTLDDVRNFLTRYALCLEQLLGKDGFTPPLATLDVCLPGTYFDRTPQNIMLDRDGAVRAIDTEWTLRADIEFGHLLFRSLLWMLGTVTRFGAHAGGETYTRESFVLAALRAYGFHVSPERVAAWLDLESSIQEQVTGRPTRDFLQLWKQQALPIHDSALARVAQQTEIDRLKKRIEDLTREAERQGPEVDPTDGKPSSQTLRPPRRLSRLVNGGYRASDIPGFKRTLRRAKILRSLARAVPRAISFYDGSPTTALRRVAGVVKREGIAGLLGRARILTQGTNAAFGVVPEVTGGLYGTFPAEEPTFAPKVTVIVPNYNHAKFLPARLDSIFDQTYANFEVILLDDCSTDDSASVLRRYAQRHASKTRCVFNDVNSGGVFNQWKKGVELATGELIWLAESDDYCSPNFLTELVRAFRNPAVMLAFCRTEFVRGEPPVKIWSSEEYLSDLTLDTSWNSPFVRSAHHLVKSGWAVKNLVPNASGALFRNPGAMPLFDDAQWRNLRMCGDWIFYLSVIRGGLVGYTPSAVNYYRQHAANTSVNTQKEEQYYREHATVARYLGQLYALDRADFERKREHLYAHWVGSRGEDRQAEFDALYNVDDARVLASSRKPNLMMAVYALTAGGGETFPIMLANAFRARGYAVTLLNYREKQTEPGVKRMIAASIPVLELDHTDWLPFVARDMGIEIVHSHHAWVDVKLATDLINEPGVKHVVTMHGMYEMMRKGQVDALIRLLERRVDRVVYTAEKNRGPFSPDFQLAKGFVKIDNALPIYPVTPAARQELGIAEQDFVLCLVARALEDKGWGEAIEAVELANAQSARRIHLLLIGEGPEYDRLKPQTSSASIHFLGFRSNIRDFFAMSDMGLIASRFKGESYPLVLIDCLHTGKPVLATDIGEIRNMLSTGDGLAGAIIELEDWTLPVHAMATSIVQLANDKANYQTLLSRVAHAAAKFDLDVMTDKYVDVYEEVLRATA